MTKHDGRGPWTPKEMSIVVPPSRNPNILPSGNLLHNYGKWPIETVSFPSNSMVIVYSYVDLPEGRTCLEICSLKNSILFNKHPMQNATDISHLEINLLNLLDSGKGINKLSTDSSKMISQKNCKYW